MKKTVRCEAAPNASASINKAPRSVNAEPTVHPGQGNGTGRMATRAKSALKTLHPSIPPTGVYDVRIVEARTSISRSGHDMLELKIEIAKGKHKGAELRYFIIDDQLADQRIFDVLTSCGVTPIPRQVSARTFHGLTGRAMIKHERCTAEKRATIYYWMHPTPEIISAVPLKTMQQGGQNESKHRSYSSLGRHLDPRRA